MEKELEQRKSKGKKGVQKHMILQHELDRLITNWAKQLGISQSQVMEELMRCGISMFEVNHGFKIVEKRIEDREKPKGKEDNEKLEREMEQKRRGAAKKTNDLAIAYERSIIFGNNEEWQSQGNG